MKKIYIYKDRLNEYQEYPIPKNLDNYHQVEVEDGFDIIGKIYNPNTKTFDKYIVPITWDQIRLQRDEFLKETDWTQLPDVPVATQDKYKNYRQDLRDITENFNTPDDVIFPEKP